MVKGFTAHNKGQSLVEYAIILVLIAIVVIILVSALGSTINSIFNRIVFGFEEQRGGSDPDDPPPECYSSLLLPLMVSSAGLGVSFSNLLQKKRVEIPAI